jgi:hypothetical protein
VFPPCSSSAFFLLGITALVDRDRLAIADFLPALRNSQAIEGWSQSLPSFDLLILTNETHALVSINVTTKTMSEIGYVAVGFGTGMNDALMLAAWPNKDFTWFVSLALTTSSPRFASRKLTSPAGSTQDPFGEGHGRGFDAPARLGHFGVSTP